MNWGNGMLWRRPVSSAVAHRRFQNFVVVGRNEAIEGVTHKAEAEMGGSQSPGLLRCDQTRFTVGIVFPEAIRCGFDPTSGSCWSSSHRLALIELLATFGTRAYIKGMSRNRMKWRADVLMQQLLPGVRAQAMPLPRHFCGPAGSLE